MRAPCSPGLTLSAVVALAVPGCAEAPAVLPRDGGVDAFIDPRPSEEPLVCDEVVTWPTSNGTDTVRFHRYRWDPVQRIRTQEERNDSDFDGTVKLAWRYDSAGKEIAYVGFERPQGSQSFQRDNQYDEHANLSDSRLSYPDEPDLNAPSQASVWMGTSFEHEYDADEKLRASVITPYGPGNSTPLVQNVTYGHDAAGRCETKLTNVEGRPPISERFVYDDQNRVIEEHQTGRSNPPLGCMGSITVIAYDARDRVESRRTWVCGHPMESRADIEIIHSYGSDGARRTETFDFLDDVVNHKVVTPDGEERWASYTITEQSAACAQMAAAISDLEKQADRRCRAR